MPLLDELRAHRAVGAALRESALEKTALKMPTLSGRAALKSLGKLALNNPGKALVIGLGSAGALGKAKSTLPGFNPEIHRAQLGMIE